MLLRIILNSGQGSLPKAAGHVHFDFLDAQQSLVHIQLTCREIMFQNDDCMDHDDDGENSSKQKRRKTESSDVVIATTRAGSTATTRTTQTTRCTAELFLECVRQAGGRCRIPENCLFSLLADVRLAKAFYSQELRVHAIENRLSELVAILCARPLQEITSAYFQAQPELMLELIDLLCPKVSSASVSAAAARPTENDDELQCDFGIGQFTQSSLRCKKFGNRGIDGTC